MDRADEILRSTPREAARVVRKLLASAVANAQNNDHLDPEDLYISACYADEGTTIKRFRPRARGRASPIRKRTCHITVIVSVLPDERLERRRSRQATSAALRSRRVAASRSDADDSDVAGSDDRPNRAARRSRDKGEVHDHEGHDHEDVTEVDVADVAEADGSGELQADAEIVDDEIVTAETDQDVAVSAEDAKPAADAGSEESD